MSSVTVSSGDFDYEDGKVYELPIRVINRKGNTQPREEVDREYVITLADAIRSGDRLPPIVAFFDGKQFWLADGFHRLDGHVRAKLSTIDCMVRLGTQRDAIIYGCGANTTHGKRLTNADKRRSVMRLLNDDQWCQWSDKRIAKHCGVSSSFVGGLRNYSTQPNASTGGRLVERGGKEYRIDVEPCKTGTGRVRPSTLVEPPDTLPISPQQRTAVDPFREFTKSLQAADVPFRTNVRTDLGMIRVLTEDAIYEVVPLLTPGSLRDAFAAVLFQRQAFDPKRKAVVVGHITEELGPWIEAAKAFGVEVRQLG